MTKNEYFNAIGRRKTSSARVKLHSGTGKITINKKDVHEYFTNSKLLINKLNAPFIALDITNKFDIEVIAKGGGHASQIDAINLGVSKCLIELNPDYKLTLKKADLLKRDPREKERKKFGHIKARKKRQFTKR